MRFENIIGHDSVKQHLVRTVQDNRVSHAQLFLGPEGSGSLALAIAYAQFVNCEDKQEADSCGVCASCRKYEKLIHPDLHFSYPFFAKSSGEVAINYIEAWRQALSENPYMGMNAWRAQFDAQNKQANINIAEVHDIIKKLSFKAFESEYKVLIMWLPEYLDAQGNALLKLIEEPPEKTLFLLVAENQDRILNTIISRTQLVKIHKLTHTDINQYLIENKGIDPLKAGEISFLADGNLQSAMELLQSDSNAYFDLMIQWLRLVVTDTGLKLIQLSEVDFPKLGRENQKNFLMYTIGMMRQIVLKSQGLESLIFLQDKELDFITKFSEIFTLEQLSAGVDLLEKTHYAVERNANAKILFLDLSLQLVLLFKYKTFRQQADSIYI
ncbi:DNA polymerase III subunit [Sphingobacterium chungjuense]|uniref:DNA polymerase III subunit n=1 Tax=Sphingobacterium chungjuense TaxID=2675553 RepID=UPI00140ADABF|nr:DNA polymerase III subunit delta' [Sphingobacterium chungjuense]